MQPDHLGSPLAVIDSVRDVAIWKWDLKGEAFGTTSPDQDPDKDGTAFVFDMRFPGQRYDAATGFNQNYIRDYESGVGRYPMSDPRGLHGGISTYAYAFSNPMMWVDPDGLQAIPFPIGPSMTGAADAAGVYNLDNPEDPNNLGNYGPKLTSDDVALILQLAGITRPQSIVNPNSTIWMLTKGILQVAQMNKDGSGSMPENCPTGTLPIDKAKGKFGIDKDAVHGIKKGVGAGPRTWTGIDPDGNVWTGGPGGIGENHWPYWPFLPGGR